MQPPSTVSEKAMRKLPRWVQSRTRLGRHLAQQDAEIIYSIHASRAEAGPRIVRTRDTVQVNAATLARIRAWRVCVGDCLGCAAR